MTLSECAYDYAKREYEITRDTLVANYIGKLKDYLQENKIILLECKKHGVKHDYSDLLYALVDVKFNIDKGESNIVLKVKAICNASKWYSRCKYTEHIVKGSWIGTNEPTFNIYRL